MAGSKYIPDVHLLEYGDGQGPDDLRVFVMDLVGSSLHYVFKYHHKHFSIRTCCILAKKMIAAVRDVHEKGLVHRDIKPSNFCLAPGRLDPDQSDVYLIDFGLAKQYMIDGQHIVEDRLRRGVSGTA